MPIFQDHFLNNDNQWEMRNDEYALLQITEGDFAYIFENRRATRAWTTWQPVLMEHQNAYKVHCVIERVGGMGRGFGMIWRCTDELNCHSFEINKRAEYTIRQCIDGEWWPLRDWLPAHCINAGTRSLNELLVVQQDTQTQFFINGTLVDTVKLPLLGTDNGFGFVVRGQQRIRIHSTLVLNVAESIE